MNNILDNIIKVKKQEVNKLKKRYSISNFYSFENWNQKKLNFGKSLSESRNISIIAEIKKASPSKGIIRSNFNHFDIFNNYVSSEADAISILTDETFFKGSVNYLYEIAKIKTLPVLRKEFIIDPIQIYEARAYGADAILLISEVLSKEEIKDFTMLANELELDVLLELHSEEQFDKIDFNLNKIIGINNRDLTTFKTDVKHTLRIIKSLPEDLVIVSESGINKRDDIELLKEVNVDAVLVGEFLMKSKNEGKKLLELKEWCKDES